MSAQLANPIRLAVVGSGRLGGFHAKLAAASDRFELVAVCDPSEAAAAALAEVTGATPVSDYHEIADQVDAVVIATPTFTHGAIGADLLAHGKHCLIEKPLAATKDEADSLVELADENGVVLQVGHVERFNPAMKLAEEAIREPKFITATRMSGYTFRSTDIGAVLDMMIHDIDLVLGLVDSPVTGVTATGLSVLGDHEDMATAQLTFASGCIAQLTASRVSYEMQRTMQVFDDRGFSAIDFQTRTVTRVQPRDEVIRREFSVADLSPDDVERLKTGLFDELLVKTSEEAPAVNAIELEQTDFADAIRLRQSPVVSGAAGRDAVAVAEQVLDAMERHTWDGSLAGRRGPMALPALPPARKAG
ncbi:MAG: Gfo/Idh/MocA family oxidoreductase [Planctomycetota bacterium]